MFPANNENYKLPVNGSQSDFPSSKHFLNLNNAKKKIRDSLVRELNINESIADDMVRKIIATQHTLDHFNSTTIPASENVPFKAVVTKERVHFIIEKISAGAFSKVFKTVVIATAVHSLWEVSLSAGDSHTFALKKTKKFKENNQGQMIAVRTFKDESAVLRKAMGGKTKGFDIFYATFGDDKNDYSLNFLYDCDLQKVKFHKMSDPVLSMIKCLLGPCKGLKTLQAAPDPYVHRDIKPGNIVVSLKNKIRADLTDFGTLQKQNDQEHFTQGTVSFLDVSTTFGSLENCLLNQEKRRGIQNMFADMYACGRMFYIILSSFISKVSKKNSDEGHEVNEILTKLATKSINGPFTPDDLMRYGKESNYRMVFVSDGKDKDKDYLLQFPELEQIAENLKASCAKLTGLVSQEERIVLTQLVDLSCQMQQQDKALRPTIDQVILSLKGMKKTLSPDVSDPHTPPLKRNLSLELDKTPILELMSDVDPKSGGTAPLFIDGTASLHSNGTEILVRDDSASVELFAN